jgi:hypothetical protein
MLKANAFRQAAWPGLGYTKRNTLFEKKRARTQARVRGGRGMVVVVMGGRGGLHSGQQEDHAHVPLHVNLNVGPSVVAVPGVHAGPDSRPNRHPVPAFHSSAPIGCIATQHRAWQARQTEAPARPPPPPHTPPTYSTSKSGRQQKSASYQLLDSESVVPGVATVKYTATCPPRAQPAAHRTS